MMVALMEETAEVLRLKSRAAREECGSRLGEREAELSEERRRACAVGVGRWETPWQSQNAVSFEEGRGMGQDVQSWTSKETLGLLARLVIFLLAGFVVMMMTGAREYGEEAR